MYRRVRSTIGLLFVISYGFFMATSSVYAETLQSNSYQFSESTLGSGGLIQSNSTNYQSSSTLGDLSVGNSASTNYQVNAGSPTTSDPTLSVAINTASANFGSFSPSIAATATASFSVSNYTSYGYVVQLAGGPPKNGNSTINALASQTTSQVGTKQFGLNLVANTSPTSVGANPSHAIFGVGTVATDYATPNQYRYVSGDTIALAPSSSGVTTYTMTYLVNVDSLTIGGKYTADQVLIVTGTY